MVELTDEILKILNDPKSVKVLATKETGGAVHAIQVGSMMAPNPGTIAAGAILMQRTSKNLEGMMKKGDLASILVCSRRESCEIRAKVKELQTSGPLLEGMNQVLAKLNLQARGAWIFEPVEVWNQGASPAAGKRII